MRKAILNSGPSDPSGLLNFSYQLGDVLDSGLSGNPAWSGSYERQNFYICVIFKLISYV